MKQAKDMGYQDDSVASDNENMVTDLLAEDSDDVMKRIQEECDQEAQRDEKLLQQRIDEEIKETIGADDPNGAAKTEEMKTDESPEKAKKAANNNFVYVKKDKGNDYVKSLSEESDGEKQKSKKERKKEKK